MPKMQRTLKRLTLLFVYVIFIFLIFGNWAAAEPGGVDKTVEEFLAKMTPEEKVGQLFMPDFRKWNDQNVTAINNDIQQAIKKYHIGGVILFRENIVDIGQTVKLIDQLQNAAEIPLFIGIDQEGGLVTRLPFATDMPGNMALGAAASLELTSQVAAAIGEELKALGINVDFAPVLDVNNNPDNPVIGVRSFGSDPDFVAKMGAAYINGLHSAGIAATAKHFPGHGDTAADSHIDLPSVPYGKERLLQVELKPFREAMRQGVDMIMTAHVTFPAIDDTIVLSRKDGKEIHLPASLSYKVLTGLIREEMGYDGVIVTDAFRQMNAINDNFTAESAALLAFKAGADLILMPDDLDKAFNTLLQEVKNGSVSLTRVDASVKRILTLKLKRGILTLPDKRDEASETANIEKAQRIIGNDAHRLLEKTVSEKAVTLMRNEKGILPFKLHDQNRVVFLAPWQDRLDLMISAFRQIIPAKINIAVDGIVYENQNIPDEAALKIIERADYIVLGTYSSDKNTRTPQKYWAANYALNAVKYANLKGKPLAVMAIRNPYDLQYLPDAGAFIAVYGGKGSGPNIPAGINAIFGQTNPEGLLPVEIEGLKQN